MRRFKLLSPVVLLACQFLVAPEASAQRCVKGIPCGNTCISASKTCRVGSGTATKAGTTQPAPETPKKADTSTLTQKQIDDSVARLLYGRPHSLATTASTGDTLFVGSRMDGVFFLRTCLAAQDLAVENRRYFKTEKEALDAKYRRSRVPGC